MNSKWCYSGKVWPGSYTPALALAIFLETCALASAPAWLREAAAAPYGSLAGDAPAIVLLDERATTVKENGDVTTIQRRAYRILRPQGREYGTFEVAFNKDTRVTGLNAWSLPAQGKELEVKGKDAIETGYSSEALYSDSRRLILKIPAAEPGNVIGYEYEQKERPWVFQEIWPCQETVPVRRARYTLQLPAGWEFRAFWRNHAPLEPRREDQNRWLWEVEDVTALKMEPSMPAPASVAAQLAISFTGPGDAGLQKGPGSWAQIAQWYGQLASERVTITPEIRAKVAELTATEPTVLAKTRRLTAFVQHEIRYVAIEMGIGGLQPHSAADVFGTRYGDCKDKATLLAAMLRVIGVDSYYALVHTDRGFVQHSFPTLRAFNHVILAIRLPDIPSSSWWNARLEVPGAGTLLFFDPTDPVTPFGTLPPALQASTTLLVLNNGGEVVDLPLAPPAANGLNRTAKFRVSADGSLAGDVKEVYTGALARDERARFQETRGEDRSRPIQAFLTQFLNPQLESASLTNLDIPGSEFGIGYKFTAPGFAKPAGQLLLVRPRVLGCKSANPPAADRKYPIEFQATAHETDTFEISLPEGYRVDELPPPVSIEYPFASYRSKTVSEPGLIRYERVYELKQIRVPVDRLGDLAEFYRRIAADEHASVVLKKD
jgi:hypothetical protein